ncbi:hypothetical protein LINPERPRIM_LOCUS25854 [Linum perenne]
MDLLSSFNLLCSCMMLVYHFCLPLKLVMSPQILDS